MNEIAEFKAGRPQLDDMPREPVFEVRALANGDYVVDGGGKWYRVRANGDVDTKYVSRKNGEIYSVVKTRPATEREAIFAKSQIIR